MRLNCPSCSKRMERLEVKDQGVYRGVYHRCTQHGIWMTVAFIGRFPGAEKLARAIVSAYFLGLFLAGGIVGKLATMKIGGTLPSLGASGGVSAALAYYALAFPKHRLYMTMFSSRMVEGRWHLSYSLSAGMFAVLYVANELVRGYFQFLNPQRG